MQGLLLKSIIFDSLTLDILCNFNSL